MKTDHSSTENARERGYKAATAWHHNATSLDELRDYADTDTLPGPFRDGWLQYCDEVEEKQRGERREARAAYMALIKRRAEGALTWALLAAVAIVAGIYCWAYYTRQLDRERETQRVLELASRTQWIGAVESRRYWATPIPGQPGRYKDDSLQLYNRNVEIGLRADGTVVWRKAGPTPLTK